MKEIDALRVKVRTDLVCAYLQVFEQAGNESEQEANDAFCRDIDEMTEFILYGTRPKTTPQDRV